MTEPPEPTVSAEPNAYRLTVEVPLRVGEAMLDDLLNRLLELVDAWSPTDRDWDAVVGGAAFRDELDEEDA